ncbi:chaperone protein dnaJ 8, chloroplastic-like [Rutidosis leptorrhynchoides]|uniref:chaperone protein dnaJ 8, chloroplastic-like n=1 Tax=Rutidosis leptorrhynchoides TaxID=125765 RepID=UPI003A995C66
MACAAVAGVIGGNGSAWISSNNKTKKRNHKTGRVIKVSCSYSSSSVMDPYKTLMIQHDASESDVKKAFRRLALQYHPDVCRGGNCGVQFNQINEAYDIVMSKLREEPEESTEYQSYGPSDQGIDEPLWGMDDPDWDMWEEWMGWEGAGIRDYTSHINPYV